MKQSRLMSFTEATVSTLAGFGLSLLVQWLVLARMLNIEIPFHINFAFALIMTVVSIARGYIVRRVFEALRPRQRTT